MVNSKYLRNCINRFDLYIWSIYKNSYSLDYMGIENRTYLKLTLGGDPHKVCYNTVSINLMNKDGRFHLNHILS